MTAEEFEEIRLRIERKMVEEYEGKDRSDQEGEPSLT